jgi:hypothetical protein
MTIDYAAMSTAVTEQISDAVPVALLIAGSILGIMVGVKLFKRFAK